MKKDDAIEQEKITAMNEGNASRKELNDLFDRSDTKTGVRYLQREVAKIKSHLGIE